MKKILVILCLVLGSALASAASDLETILANMDRAAADFRGMKADVKRVNYTAIVDDTGTETGVIVVRRDKSQDVSLLLRIEEPYPVYVSVEGTKAEIYRPKIAQVEEYDLSRSKDVLQQAFALGFGTAGGFLRDNYNVKVSGEEDIAGQPTVRLDLVPKSKDMLERTPKIEIWISTKTWQAVQQKLYQANSGDYRMNTYSNVVLNPNLRNADLQLKIPKNTKRIYPQR